jgi:filamentous hemagglutinin
MPGFSQITSEQQDEVLNNLANFQGLPQTFNSSKQGQSPGGWTTYKGKPLDPGYIQRNIQLEPQIRSLLQQQINGFINQNNQKPN